MAATNRSETEIKQLILNINRARDVSLIIQLLEMASRKEFLEWRMDFETWGKDFDYNNCRIYASVKDLFSSVVPITFEIRTVADKKNNGQIEISFNKPFEKRIITIDDSSKAAVILAIQFFKDELPVLWVRAASFPSGIERDSNELRGGNYCGIRSDYESRFENTM